MYLLKAHYLKISNFGLTNSQPNNLLISLFLSVLKYSSHENSFEALILIRLNIDHVINQ